MSTFYEVITDPTNKVYIDNVELDILNRDVNIDRAYFAGWQETNIASSKPSIYDSGVIFEGKIHFIGSSKANTSVGMHCTFDGTNWESNVSTLPYNPAYCKVLVYNDELHIFGGHPKSGDGTKKDYKSQKYHYRLDKDSNTWKKVSTLPYYFYSGSAIIYNGNIRLMGGGRTSATRKSDYYYNAKKKTWKKGIELNMLLRGFYKAFVVTNSQGVDTMYFCGEKSFKNTDTMNYSKLYYYSRDKKKWVAAVNFKDFTGKTGEPNCGFADMFISFGGEVYAYGSNDGNLYKDSIRGFRIDDSTGLITSSYEFADTIYSARIGKMSHMFFYNGELYIFKEDGSIMKSNAIVYTVTVK